MFNIPTSDTRRVWLDVYLLLTTLVVAITAAARGKSLLSPGEITVRLHCRLVACFRGDGYLPPIVLYSFHPFQAEAWEFVSNQLTICHYYQKIFASSDGALPGD